MSKVILCQGIQGSGKSTWAKHWAMEEPENRVRWNNDDIRNMLGKYWVPNREHMINRFRMAFLDEAMQKGYDCVIDDMNLNPKTIKHYEDTVKYFNECHPNNNSYSLEFIKFNTPLAVCIERDAQRENPIGAGIITSTYARYKETLESWDESDNNN